MTLADISDLSQAVAALAVIASLIYAALQFRIYAKAAREARFIAMQSDIQDFRRMIATDADCARIYRDGLADLTKLESVEQWRFGAMMQMAVANWWYSEEFEIFTGVLGVDWRWIMLRPGFRQWWPRGRSAFPSGAIAKIDAMLAQTAPDAGS